MFFASTAGSGTDRISSDTTLESSTITARLLNPHRQKPGVQTAAQTGGRRGL
jgi:hypothetical protein